LIEQTFVWLCESVVNFAQLAALGLRFFFSSFDFYSWIDFFFRVAIIGALETSLNTVASSSSTKLNHR